jgi:hypothetical protein
MDLDSLILNEIELGNFEWDLDRLLTLDGIKFDRSQVSARDLGANQIFFLFAFNSPGCLSYETANQILKVKLPMVLHYQRVMRKSMVNLQLSNQNFSPSVP